MRASLISRNQRDRWLSLDMRHLAALSAVAEERSFRLAAERLGYVQSAVSQQISALERLVGARLVERDRGPHPVRITAAGELLLHHADAITTRLRAAQQELAALSSSAAARLLVGVHSSAAPAIMSALPGAVERVAPGLRVTLHEVADDADLLDRLRRGTLDAGVCEAALRPAALDAEELLEDPYVLLVPAGAPEARRRRPWMPADIARLPLIVHDGGGSVSRVEAELIARDLTPTVAFRARGTATVEALVAAGTGSAVVPRLSVDASGHGVAVVDLRHCFAPRRVSLLWCRDRPPGDLDRLRAAARELAATLAGRPR